MAFRQFPHAFLDEIRNRIPIADVVGRHVALKPKPGGEFTGLCPFHNEKTPSFTVSNHKGFYHCFGCGAHGDIFRFLTENQGMHFPDAVEQLAAEAGVPLPARDEEAEKKYQKQIELLDVVELAAQFYQQQLYGRAGSNARDYLDHRTISSEMQASYRLGYAPNDRHALKNHLLQKNVTEQQMLDAGLIIEPDGGGVRYDRFRGRLMFPIFDRRGRVIAFGGRILGDGEPKYLNSPETPLFHKGHVLYGLSHARETASKTGQAIVCEGYMDVIALAGADLPQAVAPLGTAMTADHIKLLWQLVDVPTMCLDGDNAGKRAMARTAETVLPLLKPGKSLQFVTLPHGQDPDDVLKAGGRAAVQQLLDAPRSLADILWDMAQGPDPLNTPELRAAFESRLMGYVSRIEEPSVRSYYQKEYRDRLWQWGRQASQGPGHGASKHSSNQGREKKPAQLAAADPATEIARLALLLLTTHSDMLTHNGVENFLLALSLKDGPEQAVRNQLLDHLHDGPENNELPFSQEAAKNPLAVWAKTRYHEAFLEENATASVKEAGWAYITARYHELKLQQEYDAESASKQGDDDIERLWELKKEKDASTHEVTRLKHVYEALTDGDII